MALLGNYSLLNRTPYRQFATGVSSGYRDTLASPGALKNRSFGAFSNLSATPNGYIHPMAFVMPMKPGGMASYTAAQSAMVAQTAQLYAGVNLEASSSMTMTAVPANLDQIVQLVASSSMSMAATNAQLSAAVELLASSVCSITGTAQLGGIFPIAASSSMTMSSNVSISALAFMIAEAGGLTPSSPEAIAQAVVDSLSPDLTDIKRNTDLIPALL